MILLLFLAGLLATSWADWQPCAQKVIKDNFSVCVCNATYCDTIQPIGSVPKGQAVIYISSAAGKRFARTQTNPAPQRQSGDVLVTLGSNRMQTMMGFGGAFTDAAGINLRRLPQVLQDQIIQQYYGSDGLNYTYGRVPIASCDFSTSPYSYDDTPNDFSLSQFALAPEDGLYKIPYLKKAREVNSNLKLFASPWSAPAWMKSTGNMKGGGAMKGDLLGIYYQTYAQYFIRFLEEYNKQGVTFWGVTVQNEPDTGGDPYFPWQTMYWNAGMERDFIKVLLGPALQSSPVGKNVGVIINDDNRNNLPDWANQILSDPDAAKYVLGIGVHWYDDKNTPASVLTTTHNNFPNYFIFGTEACTGWTGNERGVNLGDWARAQDFADSIINDFLNWVTGWMDWNLVLNTQGGPNWVNNVVDAPVIVADNSQEYYKNPLWYVLGHFSIFVPPGAQRLDFREKTTATSTSSLLSTTRPPELAPSLLSTRTRATQRRLP
ncbi:unnamed protein product [Caenorhabditis auriculariae]|uniref:Glucosylceramidase n=1 Tax=Caenorhabditis auriculariae TaxID=2777116 RepID=A0A8S1HBB5_9PELO|nr:unnamed protein product [Caenorhabditis auriculariae]